MPMVLLVPLSRGGGGLCWLWVCVADPVCCWHAVLCVWYYTALMQLLMLSMMLLLMLSLWVILLPIACTGGRVGAAIYKY